MRIRGESSGIELAVVVDNCTYSKDFLAEHGLSILLELENGVRILFDTGAGRALEENLSKLGVESIDIVVLSHRHYDHTSGLRYLPEGTKLIAHPDITVQCYKISEGEIESIGLPFGANFLRRFDLRLTKKLERIEDGIYFLGEIPRTIESARGEFYRMEDGRLLRDEMRDDTALAIEMDGGIALITGCSHSGILNIVRYAEDELGKVRILLGGFHLRSLEESIEVVERLLDMGIERIAPLHCSGPYIRGLIAERDARRLLVLGAGSRISLRS